MSRQSGKDSLRSPPAPQDDPTADTPYTPEDWLAHLPKDGVPGASKERPKLVPLDPKTWKPL